MIKRGCITLLLILITISIAFATENLDSLKQRSEEFKLQIELANKLVDKNMGVGKDAYKLERTLEEYKKAVDDYNVAVQLENAESANRRLQDVWKAEVGLKNEMKNHQVTPEDESLKARVKEDIDNIENEAEVLDASIDEMQLKGANVGELKRSMRDLMRDYEDVRRYYNRNEMDLAKLELQKVFSQIVAIEDKLKVHGIDVGESDKITKVEGALQTLPYALEVTQVVIDDARENEHDVTKVQNTLDEINGVYDEMERLASSNNNVDAYTKLQRVYILSVELQKSMKEFEKQDGRAFDVKAEEAIWKYEANKGSVERMLRKVPEKLEDVAQAKRVLDQMDRLVRDAKELSEQRRSYEAWNKVEQAMVLDKDLQKSFAKAIESEKTRERLDRIITGYKGNMVALERLLDRYEEKGNDVKKARKLAEDVKSVMAGATEAFERGNDKLAWKKVYRAMILANKVEKEVAKNKIENIPTIIRNTKPRFIKAKETISKLENKSANVKELKGLYNRVYKGVTDTGEHYKQGEYERASEELRHTMMLAKKLEALSEEMLEVYKV